MKTETIQVEIGKVLRLEFTRFAVSVCDNCTCDHVEIKDGDGKTLMDKSCGDSSISSSSSGYFQPPVIVTNTNTVEIFFHTDAKNSKSGWSLSWAAVTPGLTTLLAVSTMTVSLSSLISSLQETYTDYIFDQNAAWPPPAVPAQTLKPTANTRLLLANAAAAASAQIQLGSALPVSLTRPLEPDSGRCRHPALQTAVAARVSDLETIVKKSFS